MVFSSLVFVFVFLGIVLMVYYLMKPLPIFYRNVWLLLVSIFFYAWGEPKAFVLMLVSIVLNYIWGLLIDRYRSLKGAKYLLISAIGTNVLILFYFKYLVFSIETVNVFLNISLKVPQILLPIGISFYTFQAISYLVDVYRTWGKVQRNPLDLGLYIAFFPQLIAGPIVRYNTVAEQIRKRKETIEDFSLGIERFYIGFCKKVLLANTFAQIADVSFDAAYVGSTLGVDMAWLGAVAYSLQILFDFSGYSDMAIGLAKMFGFHFDENFNYPYMANSISDFWRRWHISLGTWFRDYVYIPLGGSRVKKTRVILNLFIVWALTGIWHGANWTFVLWGIFYFFLLVFEKVTDLPKRLTSVCSKLIYRFITLGAVIGGWIVFRSESLSAVYRYVKTMFGFGNGGLHDERCVLYLKEYWIFWICGMILCVPLGECLKKRFLRHKNVDKVWLFIKPFLLSFLFIVAIMYLVVNDYNPFIYFNF